MSNKIESLLITKGPEETYPNWRAKRRWKTEEYKKRSVGYMELIHISPHIYGSNCFA